MLFKVLVLVFCLTFIQAEENFEPTIQHLQSLFTLLPIDLGILPDFKQMLLRMTPTNKNKVKEYLSELVPADTARGEYKFTAIQRAQLRDLAMQLVPGNENPFEDGKELTDEQAEKAMELLNAVMPF